jgi:hypothetical protein
MINVGKNPSIDMLLVMGPSQITLVVLLFIRRRIWGKRNSWDLLQFVAKGYMPISVVENQWLRRMVLHQNPRIVFPNRKQVVQRVVPKLVTKTMEKIVMPTLESCITTTSFDLWMSKCGHDTFALVINFINSHWVPCHVTMGLFETTNTSGVVMAAHVKELLSSYNLLDKLITYMKDKGDNLSTLTRALSFVVGCVPLKLVACWQRSCFGHAFNITCQYACNDAITCLGFWEDNLKAA